MSGATGAPPAGATEYDLHGAVGIRLLDTRPADVRVVDRQLGPLRATLGRDPDLAIRFVDRLDADGPLRYLGHEDAGFTDTRYLVLRGKHKSTIRVSLPLDTLGGPCEIVAERGTPAIPLLVPILNAIALGNGLVPLHGSAFIHEGQGILTLGWAKGGKSEALLAFTARGALYVGDEWVYLDPERQWLHGLPEPMRVWAWQLRMMPEFARRVPGSDRRRLAGTGAVSSLLRGAGRLPVVGRRAPGRLATRARAIVERQLSVQVPPHRLLGGQVAEGGTHVDRLVLIMGHEDEAIVVEPADAADIARRATESFLFETADLFAHHRRFRFAFPDQVNPYLASIEERHRTAVEHGLRGIPGLLVRHPYPVEIPRLYDAIAPRLR
jgi:hypothetical protein